ncbi:MAG: SCP2 sterol-binding domain-containing protein [Anaerolineales bacterium]
MATFPSSDWMQAIKDKLNTDQQYARIAQKWEGDLRFILEPDNLFNETMWLYFDLWHGRCRDAYIEDQSSTTEPAFILSAPYGNFIKVLTGEVGPMQALMTRMLSVKGSMAMFMRNVPTVLNFVRCCQEVTDGRI